MIAVIDYGMGNLRSVINAFDAIGADAVVVTEAGQLRNACAIVLPGVGAFGDGMQNLQRLGFAEALEEEVRGAGKPFLGLCLGMQLLASVSHEHGEHQGLGWVNATVERLPAAVDGSSLRVPHIGWNDVAVRSRDGLYRGTNVSDTFYFVHSYAMQLRHDPAVSGTCTYGVEFVASLEWDNIYATQFHPEKSHRSGLALLSNFVSKVGASRA
jgi:imidazole glycerol-phosphate synthase subunit HisH